MSKTKHGAGKKSHAGLFERAKRSLAGGVNSPVRSFRSVGGDPVFVKRAKGCKIFSEDGRRLIDYCCSWGALILGHAPDVLIKPLKRALERGTSYGMPTAVETELAEMIVAAIPSIEQVRLTSSGTEAVMGAVRIARAYTGRDKVIKFEGSYHGHSDYLLVKAGSGASTLGIPDSLGVPQDFTKHTLVVPYNDLPQTQATVEKYAKEIAAMIVEPVAGNMGVVLPEPGFLAGLRKLCDAHGILLIFDEVITGFRLIYGGAQNYFGVTPDLTCLGKIIGGGMPMGAFGGRRDVMAMLAPLGGAYQAGTLSGNPVAVTAGIAALKCLARTRPYAKLARLAQELCAGFKQAAEASGTPVEINSIGSMFTVFFTERKVIDFKTAAAQNGALFRDVYHGLLERGVYFPPSPFEANFISTGHTKKDIRDTVRAFGAAIKGRCQTQVAF
ncbi:MAG: glutamate-1-semialdehyde 2,1-aminomutase [Candidatus Omnitrophica bacterium]|nr:glutamate-1-semialdehyde 2,1-aminomutase [Candidatus Omnitrophota bacterium]MDD5670630.1 glutamate-1-semialdehyde 2,1-aminomutase [Candidatus Omnitrophota bacterium]